MIQIRILRWPEISENLIAHCPRIFSKGHLPVCINPAKVTKFPLQRTCMWPEILPVTGTRSTCCVTKKIWHVGNSTVCRADHFWGERGWGGGRGVGWGAGWVLEKIQTCTLYILEVHIGKKRILHNFSVQKKTFMHVQWAEKTTCSRCSLGWQYELHFPTVMIKRFWICTCVPAKKDSQHKDLFLSNAFFFQFRTPVVTNLGLKDREASGLSGL